MALFPINKFLAQDYRNTLSTHESPQDLDTKNPLIPVIDIQKGLARPNAKQSLLFYASQKINSDTTTQISTVSTTKRVFYLGAIIRTDAAGTYNVIIEDADTGTPSTADGQTNFSTMGITGATAIYTQYMMPLPIEMKRGIRLRNVAPAGVNVIVGLLYMEEVV